MAREVRSVSLSPSDDRFVAALMQATGWSRSQVVRAALAKLRHDPLLILALDSPRSCDR